MEYYVLMGCRLARRSAQFKCEWLINGEWVEDKQRTLALEDALMDYGDFCTWDQDRIPKEMAEELIQNGKIILKGNIGNGAIYLEPKTIELCDWKKPK